MQNKQAFFRWTRRKHESSYNIIECGHIIFDDDGKEVGEEIVGQCSDVLHLIWLSGKVYRGNTIVEDMRIDADNKRRFRIFSYCCTFEWDVPQFSSAQLKMIPAPQQDVPAPF